MKKLNNLKTLEEFLWFDKKEKTPAENLILKPTENKRYRKLLLDGGANCILSWKPVKIDDEKIIYNCLSDNEIYYTITLYVNGDIIIHSNLASDFPDEENKDIEVNSMDEAITTIIKLHREWRRKQHEWFEEHRLH